MKDNKVLLVHHKKFNKWTPPGGHIEDGETADQALIREWKEELSLDIAIIPTLEKIFTGDANATPIPVPFYMDIEREGFSTPHIGYFFFVRLLDETQAITVLEKELHNARWFSKEELLTLETFDQVGALGAYAIDNYPKK